MRYDISDGAGGPILVVMHRLTFADRDPFDGVIDHLLARKAPRVVIDLSQTGFMDSAGLGMLLTLRDRAERDGVEVALRSPRAGVRELLALASFDSLFAIEEA